MAEKFSAILIFIAMSKLDNLIYILDQKCEDWHFTHLVMLDVSDQFLWGESGFLHPMKKSFDHGIFANDENFLKFIQDPNESWHKMENGNSVLDDIYCWNGFSKKYFNVDGCAAAQLACVHDYLEKTHSNLIIPFLLYGKKGNDLSVIRGNITSEKVSFES